ncbi:unnamed protein product [Angiostrongylus costaricensis]|uniref:Uncharacterized protein n=1 Tax=Angiostrongylus costaricensis TaxID=334426 RepID=A0A0R3PGF2_ANGCS|nr:unnamed protein product [Angiostrongylus costaricensis]
MTERKIEKRMLVISHFCLQLTCIVDFAELLYLVRLQFGVNPLSSSEICDPESIGLRRDICERRTTAVMTSERANVKEILMNNRVRRQPHTKRILYTYVPIPLTNLHKRDHTNYGVIRKVKADLTKPSYNHTGSGGIRRQRDF